MQKSNVPLAARWHLAFAMLAVTTVAHAASITILNPSFESPVVVALNGFSNSAPDNWSATLFDPTGSSGVFHPSPLADTPTDGVQVGYIDGNGFIVQTLSAVLTANTVYTLDTDFLARIDCCGWKGAELDLMVGSNVLASASVATLAAGAEQTATAMYTALSTDPLLGGALTIRIMNTSTVLNNGDNQIDFDNVRLDGTSAGPTGTPEPAAFALTGAGIVLLALIRRGQISR